MLNKMKDIIRF